MSITTKDRSEIVPADQPHNMLEAILGMVKDPAIDAAKLAAMLAMQERLEERQGIAAFNRAFAAMEPELPRIKKDGTVNDKQGKAMFKFASWDRVDEIIRPILRAHGFSLSFTSTQRAGEGGGLIVTGTLRHVDGHSIDASIPLPLDASGGKNSVQGAGSTFSYGKRYSATMLLNLTVAGDDDDGVAGGIIYITPEEVAKIEELLTETKADRQRFLRNFAGIENLEDMEKKNFPTAINALFAKKRQMEAQEIV